MTTGVAGVLLAGGLGRRMGGGKPLALLGGQPLLAHAVARARPQVASLMLNINAEPHRFTGYALPLMADPLPGFAGPLAGVLAGMDWAAAHGFSQVASFAADAPFLPPDLVARLAAAVTREDAEIGCATSGGRSHPVFALWPVRLADALRHALTVEDMRRMDRWMARFRVAHADWPGEPDPFFNVNTPEDLAAAQAMLPRDGRTA